MPSPAGAVEPDPDGAANAAAEAAAAAAAEEELSDLSLEQLMAVSITTASNVDEKLGDAPASVIVITRAELEERGYRQLGDIFDDLPGMDVARPYGDNWVLVYWRGFRGDVSAPFLLMIDGLPVNSLSFVDVDVPLTAVPLSAIERIEVVQGPASSVYGPNAFMGVINVITLSDAEQDGVITHARIGMGSDAARIADATLGATARYDHDLSVNLRGRWFGRRATTPTNPLGAVDGYATLDATLAYRNVRKSGVGVSATMLNVTDARYVHPGINDASGGDDAYAADGSFVGSQGFFSSAMPQPGRAFLISLWLAP